VPCSIKLYIAAHPILRSVTSVWIVKILCSVTSVWIAEICDYCSRDKATSRVSITKNNSGSSCSRIKFSTEEMPIGTAAFAGQLAITSPSIQGGSACVNVQQTSPANRTIACRCLDDN